MAEPWTCPQCGRRLRVKNQEHACYRYDLESHFEGKDPIAREVLNWVLSTVAEEGVVETLPLKTFVSFVAQSNFAFMHPMKKGVELSLVLAGPVSHPCLRKVDPYGARKSIFRFRIESEADLDGALTELVRQAYRGAT